MTFTVFKLLSIVIIKDTYPFYDSQNIKEILLYIFEKMPLASYACLLAFNIADEKMSLAR